MTERLIALVSSDLNGTLVHQHTMSDMIRLYVGNAQFQAADAVFKRQTSGTATMEEAFSNAGPLTRGLTLKQALLYVQNHMSYVNGFSQFVDMLHTCGIPFVINSTGYSVTIHAIRAQIGKDKIHGYIGNVLEFGLDGDPASALTEDELSKRVDSFFEHPKQQDNDAYSRIKATGVVRLGIQDEAAKASLLLDYARRNFPDVSPDQMVHMGDTMGDSGGITGVLAVGGHGIAFNYNTALAEHLNGYRAAGNSAGVLHLVDHKSETSDLRNVLKVLNLN